MEGLISVDLRASRFVYERTQRSSLLRAANKLVTLSADEIALFGVPSLGYTLGFLWRFLWGGTMSCGEEFCADLFGAFSACCMLETLMKALFRRDRPPYSKEKTGYILYGEWWSFPSGHTLRAAYMLLYVNALFAKFGIRGLEVSRTLMAAWVAAVALSRVALAKHYISDCIFGAAAGVLLSHVIEWRLSVPTRGLLFVISGFCITFQFGAIMVVRPLLRDGAPTAKALLASAAFYGLYGTALWHTAHTGQWDLREEWAGRCGNLGA